MVSHWEVDNPLISSAHKAVDIFSLPVSRDTWADKYRFGAEPDAHASHSRVVSAIMGHEPLAGLRQLTLDMMDAGIWNPGGRIHAGAGTGNKVTLMNCYVMGTLVDSIEHIMKILNESTYTMRESGGIGIDFSPLRPRDAQISSLVGAHASGPVTFMEMWHSMCSVIMQAGSRRGAMMATMRCDHPDIERFIEAKHTAGMLTNFNMSVLITDAFMDAVENDEGWLLWHEIEPLHGSNQVHVHDGKKVYVYREVSARHLWDKIMRSTYEYAEPGVIFIDRINQWNNLAYCEDIRATNPCGEQPLPPYGACNLGSINLARLVTNPFEAKAHFDGAVLVKAARVAVRFLNNVIDITQYPLGEQLSEQRDKRRIGVGISGLGSALCMMGMPYGSAESVRFTRSIMSSIAATVYDESTRIAQEIGPFPAYDRDEYIIRPFIQKLPTEVRRRILNYGIRNSVLLTVAPTGTTALYYGNASGGCEPIFAPAFKRKVLQPDGTRKEYVIKDYAYEVYDRVVTHTRASDLNTAGMVSAQDIGVDAHLNIQAAVQSWVDASVSKTINCPPDITFTEFQRVYTAAFEMGCKGCTTYRPSSVRGSVLEAVDETGDYAEQDSPPQSIEEPPQLPIKEHEQSKVPAPSRVKRPETLEGMTHQIRWPNMPNSIYMTVNYFEGRPYEVLFTSVSAKNFDWMTALSRMISAILRRGGDISFIPKELSEIVSAHESAWIDGKYYSSLVSRIGEILSRHIAGEFVDDEGSLIEMPIVATSEISSADIVEMRATIKGVLCDEIEKPLTYLAVNGEICPKCDQPAYVPESGCMKCMNCGHSECN